MNYNKKNKKLQGHSILIDEKKSSSLGNRELDKLAQNIYKKYNRKHIAQYALTVGSIIDNSLEKRRQKNLLSKPEFKLKLENSEILKTINKSLCSCGRDVHFMNDKKIIDIKQTKTSKNLKGLKSCGNNASCPVCSAKLSFVRGNQLKELMTTGRDNNRSYMMIVTTIPHKPLEALKTTLEQVQLMSNYIFNSKEWKKLKVLLKCRFVHGGLENMVSFKNGQVDWHPHKNYLLDFDITTKDILNILNLKNELELRLYFSNLFTKIGQRFLKNQKIEKNLLTPYMQQDKKSNRIYVKGGVSASLEFDDKYIAKWGLDAEMTSGIYKDGRFNDSFHPFGLLDFIDNKNTEVSEKHKYQCIKAFQEFVVCSKGKRWFYFGRGAIDYYNNTYGSKIKVKKDEQELMELEDKGDLIYSLTFEEWKDFAPTPRKIGTALSIADNQKMLEYIYTEIEKNRIKNFNYI